MKFPWSKRNRLEQLRVAGKKADRQAGDADQKSSRIGKAGRRSLAERRLEFASRRKQQVREGRWRAARAWVGRRWRLLALLGIGVVFVVILISIGFILQQTQALTLKHIEVVGNDKISATAITDSLNGLLGKSLLGIDTDQIESDILKQFPFLKAAYVRKFVPDQLLVEVVERFPVMVYVNLAGAVTVDDEQIVANQLAAEEVTPLTKEELLILDGYGDPESPRVRDFYLTKIEDSEQRAAVKWEEISPDDKKRTLDSLREDYRVRVEARLGRYGDLIAQYGVQNLPLVQSFDITIFRVGQKFPADIYQFTSTIWAYLQSREVQFQRILWQTQFNIAVEIDGNTKILFSTARPVLDQIQALETVRRVENISNVNVIDLRAALVSVR